MHIVVCIKQVPDSGQIRVHPVTNTIMRQGVPTIINPYDLFALEEALRLKDKLGATVTVLTMGPPTAADSLRKALTFGADRAVLLTDRYFAGSDTLACETKTLRPSARTASAASAASSCSTSWTTMSAPRAARSSAWARPIPRPEPVIQATLPSSLFGSVMDAPVVQIPTMVSPPLGLSTCPVMKSASGEARKATA